jgi:hypothetical protein
VLQVAAALTALDCEVDVTGLPGRQIGQLPNMRLQRSSNLFGIRHVRIGFSFKKYCWTSACWDACRRSCSLTGLT